MKTHVFTGENDHRANKARQIIKKKLKRLYSGWSDDYDQEYDSQAIWFAIERDEVSDFTATVKLLFRGTERRNHLLLPMERGDISSFSIPLDINGYAFEASGLSFSYEYEADLDNIMHLFLSWLQSKGVGDCYSILHRANRFVLDYDTNVAKFKIVDDKYVIFSNFRRKQNPVKWQVICQSPSDREEALIQYRKRGANLFPSSFDLSIKVPWESDLQS